MNAETKALLWAEINRAVDSIDGALMALCFASDTDHLDDNLLDIWEQMGEMAYTIENAISDAGED